jgi:hypothetical protein
MVAAAAATVAPARTPILTTAHFAFYDDFDTNLNDALIAAGVARKAGKPEIFRAGSAAGSAAGGAAGSAAVTGKGRPQADARRDEPACFAAQPGPARLGWDTAVDYYEKVVSPADFGDHEQLLVRFQLAGFDTEIASAADRDYVGIVRGLRAAAAPAYAACRWPEQDRRNRDWIDALKPRLAEFERTIATRLAALYQTEWTGLPMPVDVVETVGWAGANSILLDAGGGHLLVSASYEGASALEVVFHESSHTLMGHGAPVQKALEGAAKAAGVRLPGDLWHVVLFDTTGETVRRVLEEGGQKGYTPMLNGILARGDSWTAYRAPLETAWRPYLDGRRSLSEAAADLIQAVAKQNAPQQTAPQPGAH